MNRTSEFFLYLHEEKPNQNNIQQTRQAPKQKSRFAELSDSVNAKISESSNLCSRLYSLVNGDNVLGENDREISELILQLKSNIELINGKIGQVESMQRESPLAAAVAQNLRNSLMEISDEFNKVVKSRAEKAREQQKRRSKYGAYHPSVSSSYNAIYDANGDDEVEIPVNDLMLEERNLHDRLGMVQNVESSINSIVQMMANLSEIIASQDFTIARIDENTTLALENMKKGELEMLKYKEKVMNNKWFILKVFVIMFIFACIFILII